MAPKQFKTAVAIAALLLAIALPIVLLTIGRGAAPGPATDSAITLASQTTVAESIPDSQPAEDDIFRYVRLCALPQGEVLRNIPPPFSRGREVFWREDPRAGPTVKSPAAMFMRLEANDVPAIVYTSGTSYALSTLLTQMLGVYLQEMEGDAQLRQLVIPGDFVYRPNAAPEEILAALQKIVRARSGQPAILALREVPRTVIVLRGQWKWVADPAGESRIQIYGSLLGDPEQGDRVTDNARVFAGSISRWISRQILLEARDVPEQIRWHYNAGLKTPDDSRDPTLVLNHLAEQTGLTWTQETRTVRRLFIEQAK